MFLKFDKFNEREPFYFDYKEISTKPEDKKANTENHFHNFFEIYLIESGECQYFIDNKVYEIVKGDIVLIPEGIIHNTKYKDNNYSRMLINCSYKYIPSAFNLYQKNAYVYRNNAAWKEIYYIFKKVLEEYKKKEVYSDEILQNYTEILFFHILRNKNYYINNLSSNPLIEDSIKYIQENYSSDITLKNVAKHFSVSPEHLSREFKKVTSFGFCKYLTLFRLKKAQSILKSSEKTMVADVASRCGFNDSNYFSLKFKEMYGISPKQMQLSHKAGTSLLPLNRKHKF